MSTDIQITHTEENGKGAFVIDRDGKRLAEMAYTISADHSVVIVHTQVDDALRGTGSGKKLLAALVEWARANQKKVVPICPFAKSVFEKTPEFQDVLK